MCFGSDWRGRYHDTHYRLQRGICDLQKSQFQCLGMAVRTLYQGSNRQDANKLECQDLGGQTSIRPYWRCYYANTAAVIFVIDSTDIERLSTASEELAAMLNEDELKDAALLVFANKQDQPGAKGAGDISEALRLGELRDRNWSIVACSAVDGRGVNEGMDWLVVRIFYPLLYVANDLQANGAIRDILNIACIMIPVCRMLNEIFGPPT